MPLQIEYRALGADLVALVLVVMAGQKKLREEGTCAKVIAVIPTAAVQRDKPLSAQHAYLQVQCILYSQRAVLAQAELDSSNLKAVKTSLKPPSPPPFNPTPEPLLSQISFAPTPPNPEAAKTYTPFGTPKTLTPKPQPLNPKPLNP